MKGFLATQKIVVTSFVDSARSLLTTGLYDSEEIEGILGDIEERWEDIHTKVNDCEVWLGELTTKHKSCQESVGSIMAFLDQAEIVLHNFSSFDVDLEGLNSQKSTLDVSMSLIRKPGRFLLQPSRFFAFLGKKRKVSIF